MTFLLLVVAAVCYAAGGTFMKLSHGFTEFIPTLLLFITVGFGVVIQTLVMRHVQLGISYLVVLGLESTLALVVSIFIFREGLSGLKVLGFLLVLSGIGFLHLSQP